MNGTATITKTLPTGPAVVETTTLDAAGRVTSVTVDGRRREPRQLQYSYFRHPSRAGGRPR
jgi:hypothetical protein